DGVAAIVEAEVGERSQSMTFADWYGRQAKIQDAVLPRADAFGFDPELVRYATPEVMLATVHAEFFSEFDGETYVELLPALFEGYNVAFGPAANDREMSAGLAQLTEPTFLEGDYSMVGRYGRAARALR